MLELILHFKDYTAQSLSHWSGTIDLDSARPEESFGQLVVLGFDVTVFTPTPYQRHRL